MRSLSSTWQLILLNAIRQMRSYPFLIVIGLTLFISYASVPASSAGYEVMRIGSEGIRGIYNSAWLSAMVTLMSSILLWLFGFYLLRGQITSDENVRMGQFIASSPIGNLRYILTKTMSNFVVLMIIQCVLVASFMVMQFIRGESDVLDVWDFIFPILVISVPSYFLLAALTIFFDVVPFLKGIVGHIIYFFLWSLLFTFSITNEHAMFDLIGFNMMVSDIVQEAAVHFPAYDQQGALEDISIGYYTYENIQTFEWQGVDWNLTMLVYKLPWVIFAMIIIFLSSFIFNRFAVTGKEKKQHAKSITKESSNPFVHKGKKSALSHDIVLTLVKHRKRNVLAMLFAEIHVMLKEMSRWWYIIAFILIALSVFLPIEAAVYVWPFVMIWPIRFWSQIGIKEHVYRTHQMLTSSCSPFSMHIIAWVAGIFISLVMSTGVCIKLFLTNDVTAIAIWLIGSVFIPTFAFWLNRMSKSRKPFEVIYAIWWYMGPYSGMMFLDFIGGTMSSAMWYGAASIALLLLTVLPMRKGIGSRVAMSVSS
ncbi:hypothetical protein [Longirhabdus pacifica]|uniref:hypothetical protein n=1 Tax=Longirhabdus pacifica TaxID=2305227 RepID=UPI0010091AFF|nr:hypothetical protein [Longirhabdus pacifica]